MYNIKLSLVPHIETINKNIKREAKNLIDKVSRRGTDRRRIATLLSCAVAEHAASELLTEMEVRQCRIIPQHSFGRDKGGIDKTVEDLMRKNHETSQFEEDPAIYQEELETYLKTLKEAIRLAKDSFCNEVFTLRDDSKAILVTTSNDWRSQGIVRQLRFIGPNEISKTKKEFTVKQIKEFIKYENERVSEGYRNYLKPEEFKERMGFDSFDQPHSNLVLVDTKDKKIVNAATIETLADDVKLVAYDIPHIGEEF